MKLGSLFDGIGGFPLVATWYGIEPVWASEIEAAPISDSARYRAIGNSVALPCVEYFITGIAEIVRRMTHE